MSPQLQAMYWLEEIGIAEYAGTIMVDNGSVVRVLRADSPHVALISFYCTIELLPDGKELCDPVAYPPYVQIGFRKAVKKWLAKRKGERKRNDQPHHGRHAHTEAEQRLHVARSTEVEG